MAGGFPTSVDEVFQQLSQDLTSLQIKWQLYRDLFADAQGVTILDDSAREVFQAIEECFRVDITMSFGRLLDNKRTSGQDNASVEKLLELCKAVCSHTVTDTWTKKLDDIRKQCQPIVLFRHKRIAHNDYNSVLKPSTCVLPKIGESDVNEGIRAIGDLLNEVQCHFTDGETCYTHRVLREGGKRLLFVLEQGLKVIRANGRK